jgi:hypothetical protein
VLILNVNAVGIIVKMLVVGKTIPLYVLDVYPIFLGRVRYVDMPDPNFVSFLIYCLFLCLFPFLSSIQFLERLSNYFILDLMEIRLDICCVQKNTGYDETSY